MNDESFEQELACYEPSGPPSGLREEVLKTAFARERTRKRTWSLLTIGGLTLLTAAFLNVTADRLYQEAIRVAGGDSQLGANEVVARASLLSLQIPGARDLLRWNGGSHE